MFALQHYSLTKVQKVTRCVLPQPAFQQWQLMDMETLGFLNTANRFRQNEMLLE